MDAADTDADELAKTLNTLQDLGFTVETADDGTITLKPAADAPDAPEDVPETFDPYDPDAVAAKLSEDLGQSVSVKNGTDGNMDVLDNTQTKIGEFRPSAGEEGKYTPEEPEPEFGNARPRLRRPRLCRSS